MSSDNDSRKRRRVTREDDTDATPRRVLVSGRIENEGHDFSWGHMEEAMSDFLEATRRKDNERFGQDAGHATDSRQGEYG